MRENEQKLDTIYCDSCNQPVVLSNGRFLRPVIVLCHSCKERTKWSPEKKFLDKRSQRDDT